MREGPSGPETGQPTRGASRRVTVTEAAWILDTTVDALRKRIQRGTIAHERDEYGRVWILVESDRTRHDTDRDTTGQRQDYGPGVLMSEMRGRIEDLRTQLEAERQAHAEARRLLAAALERIPPQLEAPSQEPRESPESPGPVETPTEAAETPPDSREYAVTEQAGRVEPQPTVESAQGPREPSHEMHMPEAGGGPLPRDQQRASERSWWRRMFGG